MALPAEQLARSQGLTGPLYLAQGVSQGELAAILGDASREANRMMLANMARAGSAPGTAQLRAATQGLGSLSQSLWGRVGAMTRAGIHQAADMAVNSQLDRDFLMGMPFNGIRQYTEGMFFNAFQSAEDIISRRTKGINLAERIYRNSRGGTLAAGRLVERGLASQWSARRIAHSVRDLFDPNVPGGVSYAAMRLARTEINNAHHTTTIRLADDLEWVLGYKWNLSGSHPKPDICNSYADEDHDGLGKGVYKKGNAPGKPHPQCLCYVTVMQPDRATFLKGLTGGKYDNGLARKGVRCNA